MPTGLPARYRHLMPNPTGPDQQPGDPATSSEAPGATDALSAALAEAGIDADTVDPASLAAGLLLGLERPDRARQVLVLLAGRASGAPRAPVAETGSVAAAADALAGTPAVDKDAGAPDEDANETTHDGGIPTGSMLLARAASMAMAADSPLTPETTFGWAARLTRDEVLSMGRVVGEMLAGGASKDVERGFGLTWTAGVRLPSNDFAAQFKAFTDLEVTVASVLAGADLRTTVHAPQEGRIASLFGSLMPRADPVSTEAAAVIERAGEPAKRGLVTLWNAWMAMCYRSVLPDELFETLVHPWVTVVGQLPSS
jgi:hypothetical protein